MEEFVKAVGAYIKEWRTLKGLSRRGLGEKIGLSGQAIWKIETGRSDPRLKNLGLIAEALGVEPAALITGRQTISLGDPLTGEEHEHFMSLAQRAGLQFTPQPLPRDIEEALDKLKREEQP